MNVAIQDAFERLETTRAEVLRLLEGHDHDVLNRTRGDGGWSALQVLHHVVAAEGATLAYIKKKMQAGTAIPRAGLRSRLRLLALRLALASPLRFRAPAATASVPPEIDAEKLRADWESGRGAWRALLTAFPEDLVARQVFRHPLVGRMGLSDTLGFMRSHLDHHARQVERALARR